MSIIYKVEELCRYNGTSISELEKVMGYSNGSIRKSSSQTLRSDRVQEIAEHFNVTPTYLLSDNKYCICSVCSFGYDPLNDDELQTHSQLHERFKILHKKIGFLLNTSQAANKRLFAKKRLKNTNLTEDEKIHTYETLLLCDFADYASEEEYIIEIDYSDFVRNELMKKKYFDLITPAIIQKIAQKYNVQIKDEEGSFCEKIQADEEFMANVSNLWDLPQEFRADVYKEIRHAKRDLADREYFTKMYPGVNPFN